LRVAELAWHHRIVSSTIAGEVISYEAMLVLIFVRACSGCQDSPSACDG